MIVEQILHAAREQLFTITIDAPLLTAAQILGRKEANLVVVCDAAGVLAGVIAKTDIVRQIGYCDGYACRIVASAAMTRSVVSCRPADFLKDVWAAMKRHGLKHIPVIDADSRPAGLLVARQVLDFLLDEAEYEEQLLRDYVMSIGYH